MPSSVTLEMGAVCFVFCSGWRFAMLYFPRRFPMHYTSPPSWRYSCCIPQHLWCHSGDCGWQLPVCQQTASTRLQQVAGVLPAGFFA